MSQLQQNLAIDQANKYNMLKKSLQLPLKISLYFNSLESGLEMQPTSKVQQLHGFTQLFFPTFCRMSIEEKYSYLCANLEFIKMQYDRMEGGNSGRLEQYIVGSNVRATGQICESIMSVTYWIKVELDLNFQRRKLGLVTKKKIIQLDLRLYLVRKSRKHQNTLVLQAISDIVSVDDRKISLFFKSSIFENIYSQIFKCIVNFRNEELYKYAMENLQVGEVSYIGKNSRSLNFLTAKNVNEYLSFKEQLAKKMMKSQYKFKKLKSPTDCIVQRDQSYNSTPGCSLYKLQKQFPYSPQFLKWLFVQKHRSHSNHLIIQSNPLQSLSKYRAVYQKLLFNIQNETFIPIQHMIIQEINTKSTIAENQELLFVRGVPGAKLNCFVEFLLVKVRGIGGKGGSFSSKLVVFASFFHRFQGRKKGCGGLQSNQAIVIQYLVQLAQMVDRAKEDQHIEKLLSQIREKPLQEAEKTCEIEQGQFATVQGNINLNKHHDHQEIVLDFEEQEQNIKDSKALDSMLSSTEYEGSQKNSYLNHQFLMGPHAIIINGERIRKLKSSHFIYGEWARRPKGGLFFKDQTAINQQKKVIKFIVKTLGKRIMEHKDILNISLPVTIFSPESYLHSVARNISFAPILLQKAVSQQDPVSRIKHIILYAVSVTISGISINKPFNPVLGQTLQVWIDQCPVYLEQISHHPPISSYYMIGRGYKAYGSIGPKVKIGLNSVIGINQYPNFVELDDGTLYEMNLGKMHINGVIFGERTVNFLDKITVMDRKSNIFAQLKFQEQKSLFSLTPSQHPTDHICGRIYKISDQLISQLDSTPRPRQNPMSLPTPKSKDTPTPIVELCRFEGNWNGPIFFDEKLEIDFGVANACVVEPEEFPLPSDSCFRDDITLLGQGLVNQSQEEKEIIQVLQRRDADLRKSFKAKK